MSSEDLAETIAALNTRIDARIAEAQRLADDAARLEQEARDATATVSSPDGLVTVTAHATGAVASVRFDSIGRADAASLGATVTATIARAQRAAADLVIGAMEQSLGAGSPLVAAVRSDVDAAFPENGGSTIGYR